MSVTNRVWWGRDSSIVDAISLGIRADRGNVDLDEDNNCLRAFGEGGLFEDIYTNVQLIRCTTVQFFNVYNI